VTPLVEKSLKNYTDWWQKILVTCLAVFKIILACDGQSDELTDRHIPRCACATRGKNGAFTLRYLDTCSVSLLFTSTSNFMTFYNETARNL